MTMLELEDVGMSGTIALKELKPDGVDQHKD